MYNDIKESEQYKGYTINIRYDGNCESPREWDNLGTIYSNHRDYNVDGHKIDELPNDGEVLDYDALNAEYIWLTVSCYEHGGITFWCGTPDDHYDARWDCGIFGIIAVSKARIRKDYKWKLLTKKRAERIQDILEEEIKTLDDYCQGFCYGYEVLDEDENLIDSCYGFIGNEEIEYIYSEAKSIIDYEVKKREEEAARVAHIESIIDLCWAD